jgi:hypothetical protein
MTPGRASAPGSTPGALARKGLADQTEAYRRGAAIYRDEVEGRLRAIGCALVLAHRGELDQADADEAVSKLVIRADQWMRVYEAERGPVSP